jgi:hypothetical protein
MTSTPKFSPDQYPPDKKEATHFIVDGERVVAVNLNLHPNFGADDDHIERLRPVQDTSRHTVSSMRGVLDPEDHDPTGGFFTDPHDDLLDK